MTRSRKPAASPRRGVVQARSRRQDDAGARPTSEGAPDRRPVWHLLVMRGFIIVAVMFWLALAYQNSHRDFGQPRIEAVR